ncbi:MAG: esterase-like activity of phytase family protein [Sporomusaceae bacterium]|nr:esterase-like activity of phytase family protein [Sporomusaceae bacterium]
MKRTFFKTLAIAAALLSVGAYSNAALAAGTPTITKYLVTVPQKYFVNYQGPSEQSFPRGFLPGFGSAIALKAINPDGSIELYGITDRGPNGDGPKYQAGTEHYSSKFFPSPQFQPQIGIIRIKDGKAEVTSVLGLKDEKGKAITGLPIEPGLIGATNEIALDDCFKHLGYDNRGMDTEGIALDAEGNFWVCDEYGPFIAQYDKKGKLLKKYAPGQGLPAVMKYRTPNRGFEGLTITPAGLVYAAGQSPLDIEGKSGKTAQFSRIVELDPKTGKTKMLAYPIDTEAYKAPKDAKIGDIYAVSDTRFLVIEQGKGKDKQMRNLIYLVDIQDATDLTGISIDGKEPEFTADKSKLAGIRFAKKQLLVDLRAHGWNTEKAEGLFLMPDQKTIVVTNDNDFGMAMAVEDATNGATEPGDYTLQENGAFSYEGKPANPRMHIVANAPEERQQSIWFIELQEALY